MIENNVIGIEIPQTGIGPELNEDGLLVESTSLAEHILEARGLHLIPEQKVTLKPMRFAYAKAEKSWDGVQGVMHVIVDLSSVVADAAARQIELLGYSLQEPDGTKSFFLTDEEDETDYVVSARLFSGLLSIAYGNTVLNN